MTTSELEKLVKDTKISQATIEKITMAITQRVRYQHADVDVYPGLATIPDIIQLPEELDVHVQKLKDLTSDASHAMLQLS